MQSLPTGACPTLLPDLKIPGSKTTPLGIGPIPRTSPYLEWGTPSQALAPKRMGPPSAPLIQATSDFPKNGGPIPTPPLPPKIWQPSPPQLLLPRPPNLICLLVGRNTHFSEAQTSVPNHRGLRVGKGPLFRSPSQRFRSRRWLWVAALLGSLSGSGRAGACPQLSPRSGCGRPVRSGLPRQRADLSSSLGTRPSAALRCGSPGSVRTGTRRPAAQDDIKSPPPARPAPPRGLGGVEGGCCVSKFPGPLGDVVPALLKGGCQTRGVTPAGAWGQSLSRVGWIQLGLGSHVLERSLHRKRGLGSLHQEAGGEARTVTGKRPNPIPGPKIWPASAVPQAFHPRGNPTLTPEWPHTSNPLGKGH